MSDTASSSLTLIKDLKIETILSWGTVILVVLGTFNLYSFYQFFGIDITSYIDPSEIIFSFTSLLSRLIGVFLALSALLLYRAKILDKTMSKPWFRIVDKIIVTLAMIMGVIMFSTMLFSEMISDFKEILFLAFLLMLAAFISFGTDHSLRNKTIAVVVIAIFYLQTANKAKHDLIMKDKSFTNVELLFLDSTVIKSSDELRYVGTTRNFVFFYNLKESRSLVYPKSELKLISILYKPVDYSERVREFLK